MDSFVTARVPEEIKLQGNRMLKEIDATPTQLVNDAYRFVISHGCLPTEEKGRRPEGVIRRVITDAQRMEIEGILNSMRVASFDMGKPFDEALSEARDERYAIVS